MEMRLRTPVTRGYFFLLGALRLVNAASPRTISVHKKKISSGTQGSETYTETTIFIQEDKYESVPKNPESSSFKLKFMF